MNKNGMTSMSKMDVDKRRRMFIETREENDNSYNKVKKSSKKAVNEQWKQ